MREHVRSGKLVKCSTHLHAETYQMCYGELPLEVREKLLRISPATMRCILLPTTRKLGKGKSMFSSDQYFRDVITIALDQWQQREL
jgi:hypothetical protein